MKKLFNIIFLLIGFTLISCANSDTIFPVAPVATSESGVVLQNPIDIAIDAANSQIIVSNSNVDVAHDTGSLTVLSVDASDTDSPTLTAEKVLRVPNFSGEILFDAGTSTLYVPFREESTSNEDFSTIGQYDVDDGDISKTRARNIAEGPYGITAAGNQILVVSDDTLSLFDTSLDLDGTVSLTDAEDDVDDSDAEFVESVVYDATENRAIISNAGGRMFVVNLDSDELVQVIRGPTSSRAMVLDGDTLYVLDPVEEIVWVFDITRLPTETSLSTVDDSTFLITTIPVGNNPGDMALEATTGRLFVTNTDDDTVSVIDTTNLQEITRIPVGEDDLDSFDRDGESPFGVQTATFNATPYVFVTGFEGNSIMIIAATELKVLTVYPENTL